MADLTDDVIWNPCVDSTGSGATINNRYDIPGSTFLDNTFDSGALMYMPSVGATGTGPTGSHWNQLIGVINNRITKINTKTGTTRTTSPLVSNAAATRNRVAIQVNILDLRSQIDFIRNAESSTPYVWSTDFDALGTSTITLIRGYHLAEMRKALAGRYFSNAASEAITVNRHIGLAPASQYVWPRFNTGTTSGATLVGGQFGDVRQITATFQNWHIDTNNNLSPTLQTLNPAATSFSNNAGVSGTVNNIQVGRTTYFFRMGSAVAPTHGSTQIWMNPYTGTSNLTISVQLTSANHTNNILIYFGNTGFTGAAVPASFSVFSNVFDSASTYGGSLIATLTSPMGSPSLFSVGNVVPNTWYFIQTRLSQADEDSQKFYDGTGHNITFNENANSFKIRLDY